MGLQSHLRESRVETFYLIWLQIGLCWLHRAIISARKLAEVAGHADPDFLGSTHFSVDLTPDHDCGHCKEASI